MSDWGFDVDWSLGQRVNLQALQRNAPRFFRRQSQIETLTVLQSHWNDHMKHLMAHKHFIGKQVVVPILKGPAMTAAEAFQGGSLG